MAITETSRHRLHTTLETVLGEEQAATLMEHLPPTGWGDVATKRDLDHLREIMDVRFEQMVTKGEFHRTLRMHTLALVGTNLVLWGTVAGKLL